MAFLSLVGGLCCVGLRSAVLDRLGYGMRYVLGSGRRFWIGWAME